MGFVKELKVTRGLYSLFLGCRRVAGAQRAGLPPASSGSGSSCRAMSSDSASGEQHPQHRGLCTNSEGTGPPRVLITGGLGQLGNGLAKQLR